MPIFSQDNDPINGPHDDEPIFEDDPAHVTTSISNPVADAFTGVMGHFSGGSGIAPQNEIIRVCTLAYLDAIDRDDPPHARDLEKQLLAFVNGVAKAENSKTKVATEKLPLLRVLSNWQVAQILLSLHHVVRIAPTGEDTDREYDLLGMYVAEGRNRGVHTMSEHDIRMTARRYNLQMSLKEFSEVLAVLQEASPRVHFCLHRDLVPVNNGIFHYGSTDLDLEIGGVSFHFEAKTLHPFNPALVFRAKSRVDYVQNAPMVVITHPSDGDWEIGQWIEEFYFTEGADDFNSKHEGMADLIWEIIGALIRPYVSFNKTAWFYSEQGNNGKGTLCSLARNLVGTGSHTSIPLSEFGKDFALEPLIHSTVVIVDENDVGTFVDKAANLKALVTGDVIPINRKYRMPVAFQFHGFMIQCLNEFPRVKDKSESFYRRQLFVPFTKCFTGAEKKYIKDDYLQRRDVLEYVLWYVLHRAGASDPGNYYELSEPVATKEVLAEYKEVNDPVRAFWEEFRQRFVWGLLPFTFLFDLYKAWFVDVSPSGSPVSNKQFVSDIVAIVRNDALWNCKDKTKVIRPGQMMAVPELLIAEYELKKWMDPHYGGHDPKKKSHPVLRENYRGLLRTIGGCALSADDEEPDD